jgi:DNA-binding NarL/FixJ family response regulator
VATVGFLSPAFSATLGSRPHLRFLLALGPALLAVAAARPHRVLPDPRTTAESAAASLTKRRGGARLRSRKGQCSAATAVVMDAATGRAIIADVHPLSLDSLERVVSGLGIEISASTTQLDEVADLVEEDDPDLLLLGLESVDASAELLRAVRRTHPEVKLIVLSDDDVRGAQKAFAAGVDAYCSRSTSAEDLAAAIRQSFHQSIYLRHALGRPAAAAEALMDQPYLTRREAQILRLLSQGTSNPDIARALWVSAPTVKFHLSNIYRKLNVSNRTEASRWAERHGFADVSPQVRPDPSRANDERG